MKYCKKEKVKQKEKEQKRKENLKEAFRRSPAPPDNGPPDCSTP
jgi:hypothetical protein